jgi:hypothetical protein
MHIYRPVPYIYIYIYAYIGLYLGGALRIEENEKVLELAAGKGIV